MRVRRYWVSALAVVVLAVACADDGPTTREDSQPSPDGTEPVARADDPSVEVPDETAVSLCEPAPAGTTTVLPLPPWTEGVQRELELQIGRSNTVSPTPEGFSRTPVNLTVEAGTDHGWVMRWELESTVLDGIDVPEEAREMTAELLSSLPPQQIGYELRADRVWLGVTNAEEIRAATMEMLDLVFDLHGDDPAVGQTRDLFESMPDDALARLYSEDPQVFHVLEGIELTVDDPIEFPDQLPNALGGEPFPAVTTVEILEVEDDDGCIAIQMQVLPDPERVMSILMDTLASFLPPGTSQQELEAAAEGFEIENRIVGQYDLGSGYFRRITATQRVGDGAMERVDTKIITDLTAG